MPQNSYFNRQTDASLNTWKDSQRRKPLLLRGARQVGKSSAVRHFAQQFENYIEINFEASPELRAFFEPNLDIERICTLLAAHHQTPIVDGKTLLFFDEIQACPRAISSLRFFYEQRPGLHVIAAGSLLEFALAELPSFGVGRIQSLFMYPFSFSEYMGVMNPNLQQAIQENNRTILSSEVIHQELVRHLRTFMLHGGMPEVVKTWAETHDFIACYEVLSDIVSTYTDDFAKYKTRIQPLVLQNTWQAVAEQAGRKFVYSAVRDGIDIPKVKEALDLLQMAGLVVPVTHTAANGVPLGAQSNSKFRKMLPLDTGIMLNMLGLGLGDFLVASDTEIVCKGSLAEVFAGLEILKSSNARTRQDLYYWLNLNKDRQAEVDYLLAFNGSIVPVEVKAGTQGSMQSLYYFLQLKNLPYGIRTSLEPFGELEKVHIVPLYALGAMLSKTM